MDCHDVQQLFNQANGLSENDLRVIAEHMETCQKCRETVESIVERAFPADAGMQVLESVAAEVAEDRLRQKKGMEGASWEQWFIKELKEVLPYILGNLKSAKAATDREHEQEKYRSSALLQLKRLYLRMGRLLAAEIIPATVAKWAAGERCFAAPIFMGDGIVSLAQEALLHNLVEDTTTFASHLEQSHGMGLPVSNEQHRRAAQALADLTTALSNDFEDGSF